MKTSIKKKKKRKKMIWINFLLKLKLNCSFVHLCLCNLNSFIEPLLFEIAYKYSSGGLPSVFVNIAVVVIKWVHPLD